MNAPVEVAFATIGGRARSMMSEAHVPHERKGELMADACLCATLLDGLILTTIEGITKTRFEHMFDKNPPFINCLRTWGEAGVVTLNKS
jgi:hypothetical protein